MPLISLRFVFFFTNIIPLPCEPKIGFRSESFVTLFFFFRPIQISVSGDGIPFIFSKPVVLTLSTVFSIATAEL